MTNVNKLLGSEREHFMVRRDAAKYDECGRYVFGDELAEYTFYPYGGALRAVPGYLEDRDAFEEVRIFLVIKSTGKLVRIPCNFEERFKKIYITEENFNKYWKLISENIRKGILRKRPEGTVTKVSMNKRVDLTLLENSYRSAKIGKNFTIEYKGKELDIETQRLISKRASALDDGRMRFVYAKSDGLVHDKSCHLVEKIEYWDFAATEKLPLDRELCPCCKRRLYIRKAIKSDTKRFAWYQRFFEQGRVSNQLLKKFLMNTDVTLHMDVLDELIVKCKEDTWRICMNGQGAYDLYHNNYVMVSEEERYITSGFHEQKHHPPYLPGILAYIEGYDWKKHLKPKVVADNEPKIALESEVVSVEKIEREGNIWKRLWEWLQRVFFKG